MDSGTYVYEYVLLLKWILVYVYECMSCLRDCVVSVRRFTSCISFYTILNELNDYAGQREVVAEEMGHNVYGELMKYSQDLKSERKHVSRHHKHACAHIHAHIHTHTHTQ